MCLFYYLVGNMSVGNMTIGKMTIGNVVIGNKSRRPVTLLSLADESVP